MSPPDFTHYRLQLTTLQIACRHHAYCTAIQSVLRQLMAACTAIQSVLRQLMAACCRFDNFGGLDSNGKPVTTVPKDVLDSIRRNQVCLKGTLFTPLRLTTATESLNVQMRKNLDSHVNLVHGFSLKGLPPGVIRHQGIDIVVIRSTLPPSALCAHMYMLHAYSGALYPSIQSAACTLLCCRTSQSVHI